MSEKAIVIVIAMLFVMVIAYFVVFVGVGMMLEPLYEITDALNSVQGRP